MVKVSVTLGGCTQKQQFEFCFLKFFYAVPIFGCVHDSNYYPNYVSHKACKMAHPAWVFFWKVLVKQILFVWPNNEGSEIPSMGVYEIPTSCGPLWSCQSGKMNTIFNSCGNFYLDTKNLLMRMLWLSVGLIRRVITYVEAMIDIPTFY